MLYAFSADDVVRLRKMLIAFEQGRLLVDSPPPVMPSQASRQDTFLGHITASIPANSVGTAVLVDVDNTTTPPTLTDFTRTDKTYNVLNASSSALAAGYYLLAREPSSGCYIPASASSLSPASVPVSLTGTYGSLALPATSSSVTQYICGVASGGATINGIAAQMPNQIITLYNNSSDNLTINGFLIPSGQGDIALPNEYIATGQSNPSITLNQAESITLWYDSASTPNVWRLVAVNRQDILTWNSQVDINAASLTTASVWSDVGASIALPYKGNYLLIAQVSGHLNLYTINGGTGDIALDARLYDSGSGSQIGQTAPVVSIPLQSSSINYNGSLVEGTGCLTLIYNNASPNNVVKIQATGAPPAGSGSGFVDGVVFTAYYLSPGSLPSATTVNGQTGGVNLVGTGGGGAGVDVTTGSGQINVDLSPAARAAINLALAMGNI